MDYKIGFFGVRSWERESIEKEIVRLPVYGVGIFEEEVDQAVELAANYDIISTFIYSNLDREFLKKMPKLKMVASRSTGIDHIDCEECNLRKIKVVNVAEYGSNTVAEYTFALILAVTKKIVPAHQSVEDGEFSPDGLTGVDLKGKVLGVVGVGRIGANVVKIGRGFGMKVVGVERKPDEALAKKLGFKNVPLDECLATADVLTLHVPSVAETHHLINKKNIKLMKSGSFLVNTCRGAVVETEALVWALNNKVLAGVGLDVVEEEGQVENVSVVMSEKTRKGTMKDLLSFHLLRDRDDVVFTPHNAFNTKEAVGRIVAITIDNIISFLEVGSSR